MGGLAAGEQLKPLVVQERTAFGKQDGDSLGCVDHAAAANVHDGVRPPRAAKLGTRVDGVHSGVGGNVGENAGAGRPEGRNHFCHELGLVEKTVGDYERLRAAKGCELQTHLSRGAGAEDHLRGVREQE